MPIKHYREIQIAKIIETAIKNQHVNEENRNSTIRIDGKLFRCNCGCNVFAKLSENRYRCNMCKSEYETE